MVNHNHLVKLFLLTLSTTICQAAGPLPDAFQGVAYDWPVSSCTIRASCGFTLYSGSLPPGMSISGNNITGTSTQPGLYSFTLEFFYSPDPVFPVTTSYGNHTINVEPASAQRGSVVPKRTAVVLGFSPDLSVSTSMQTVEVDSYGSGVTGWTLSGQGLLLSDPEFVNQTAMAGTVGTGSFPVAANLSALSSPSAMTAPLTITDTAGGTHNVQITLTPGRGGPPFGSFDSPVDNSSASGVVGVTGWALDDIEVKSVNIYRDPVVGETPGVQVFVGTATFFSDTRPDVEAAYPNEPISYRGGWGLGVLTNDFPNADGSAGQGNGTYRLLAYATNAQGKTAFLGAKHIICNNSSSALPMGVIDTPANGSFLQNGAINFTGWAVSRNTVAKVALCREPVTGEANTLDPHCLVSTSASGLVYLGDAELVPGSRPDIAPALPGFPNNNWGWGAQILTNELPGNDGLPLGNGTYKLHAIAADTGGLVTDLGTTQVSVTNSGTYLPFGTIDTPTQGGTASGTAFVNFGWVVTPQPDIIPIDGSTIWVYIDNVAVGHPVYNNYRIDIATLFPGLQNSQGAVGYYYIDTTQLKNGLHTISWVATDSAGNAAGLGSRYFNVQN